MSRSVEPVIDVATMPLEPYEHGNRYRSMDGLLAAPMGLTQLGAIYSEVPPGKTACPFHVHHIEDELFVVLSGTGEYRFGDAVHPVHSGCVLAAPRGGPEYAHQLLNTGTEPLTYLSISSKAEADVCEYPDSQKFQVSSRAARAEPFRFVGRKAMHLDYFEGEDD